MIFVNKGITETQLLGVTPLLKTKLREALSFKNESHIIARAVARKRYGYIPPNLRWDGITYLISANNTFQTGLLDRVLGIFDAEKMEYQILETTQTPEGVEISLKEALELWSHQKEALEAIRKHKTGVIRIGTGGGKTKLSVKTCQEIGQLPFLFVVNRISLLEQTHEEYSKYYGEPIGWIGDGKIDVQRINIATIGTICSILKIKEKESDKEENLSYTQEQIDSLKQLLKDCQFVVVDECHHAAATTYRDMLKALPNAHYRIGLSATPFRTDGTDILLEAAFGNVIYSKSASELIQDGTLCKPYIYFVEYKDTSLSKKYPKSAKGGSYTKIYSECVVNNERFNEIVAKTAIANSRLGRLTLVSVKQIKHGDNVVEMLKFLDPKLKVVFLHGKNKKQLGEDKVKKDFADHKIDILVSTLFDEGVDIPKIDAVVDAGGGRSAIKALQLVGRVLRKYTGKKKAYVYMFIQPYQHLYKHSKARAEILSTEDEFVLKVLPWQDD